jgi:hypothetical protein
MIDFLNKIPMSLAIVIATFSLFVSTSTFIRSWWKDRSESKKAKLVEKFSKTKRLDRIDLFTLTNVGSSEALNINIEFNKIDGSALKPFDDENQYKIPILSSGNSIDFPVHIPIYETGLVMVSIEWEDKRRKRQSKKSVLNLNT